MIELGGNIKLGGNIEFPGTSDYSISTLYNGLTNYYSMNDTTDSVGSVDFTINQGEIGEGKYFNGYVNDIPIDTTPCLTFGNNFNLYYNTPKTFNIWVKWNETPIGPILSKYNSTSIAVGYFLRINSGGIELLLDTDYTNLPDPGYRTFIRGGTIDQQDTWYMITVMYYQDNAKFFINGSEVTTNKSCTHPTAYCAGTHNISNSQGFELGSWTYEFDSLNGSMDEFGIWNRGLTDNEVLELYNSGNALRYPFPYN